MFNILHPYASIHKRESLTVKTGNNYGLVRNGRSEQECELVIVDTTPKPGTMEYRRQERAKGTIRAQLFYYYQEVAPAEYEEQDAWNMVEQAADMLDEVLRAYQLVKSRG